MHTGSVHEIERPNHGGNTEVYLVSAERGRFVLKCSHALSKQSELEAEAHLLSHLTPWQPLVPQPIAHTISEEEALFLFTYLEGASLSGAVTTVDKSGQHALITAYAHMLRQLHAWTPDLPVPEDWLTERLDRALINAEAGIEFDGFGRYSSLASLPPEQIASQLRQWRQSLHNDIVFGHGDYCLPNVLMQGTRVTGVIDWSAGDYMDRRFDLATAALSIRYNLHEEEFVRTFLTAYGYSEPVESLHFFEALYMLW